MIDYKVYLEECISLDDKYMHLFVGPMSSGTSISEKYQFVLARWGNSCAKNWC